MEFCDTFLTQHWNQLHNQYAMRCFIVDALCIVSDAWQIFHLKLTFHLFVLDG